MEAFGILFGIADSTISDVLKSKHEVEFNGDAIGQASRSFQEGARS
jgi:hypothetical protein